MEQCPSLAQFQAQLYSHLDNRANAVMELLNALSGNTQARSVVELSLSSLFGRHYSDLYKAIDAFTLAEPVQWHLMAPFLPRPQQRSFWLLSVDVVPHPRPYAATLEDRALVYQPQAVTSNKPITIGHAYSTLVLLPEKQAGDPAWVVPLSVRRVASDQDREQVGADQVQALLTDARLPFRQELCVEVGDTSYSKRAYLAAHRAFPNLVTLVRVRSNRVFYRAYVPEDPAPRRGHPRWYGARFALNDPQTWHPPDEKMTFSIKTARGRTYRVHIQAWRNMLMRGTRAFPMHRYPFTLVRIEITTEDGTPVHRRPLWLLVMGPRRDELGLREIYEAYTRRSDQEQYHRFSKQRLLAATYQTPNTQREERWWRLTQVAYFQLWLARSLAQSLPRPWERYLPRWEERPLSPTLVQRDFARIIRQLGTPARAAKPRGKSPGRTKGTRLPRRQRHPVVRKARSRA